MIESGVLKGLNLEDIKRAGERLILQDGCTDFFQNIIKNANLNSNIHVLSYCWCGDLIRSAFSSGMFPIDLPVQYEHKSPAFSFYVACQIYFLRPAFTWGC